MKCSNCSWLNTKDELETIVGLKCRCGNIYLYVNPNQYACENFEYDYFRSYELISRLEEEGYDPNYLEKRQRKEQKKKQESFNDWARRKNEEDLARLRKDYYSEEIKRISPYIYTITDKVGNFSDTTFNEMCMFRLGTVPNNSKYKKIEEFDNLLGSYFNMLLEKDDPESIRIARNFYIQMVANGFTDDSKFNNWKMLIDKATRRIKSSLKTIEKSRK